MPISSTILSTALPLSSSSFLSSKSSELTEANNENKLNGSGGGSPISDERTLVKMDEKLVGESATVPIIMSNEFNRPTTPPPSTPSPTTQLAKNVNKRKIKAPNNHQYAKKSDDYSDENMESECNRTEDELDEDEDEDEEEDDDELDDEDEELRADDGANELLIDETHPAAPDSEVDLDAEVDMDENNNNVPRVAHTLTAKEISKEILELNAKLNSEICNDLIVCGRCQTDFKLSDIILFIEHKIHKCSHTLINDAKQTSIYMFD